MSRIRAFWRLKAASKLTLTNVPSDRINISTMVGAMPGKVMCSNRLNSPAPSIMAAVLFGIDSGNRGKANNRAPSDLLQDPPCCEDRPEALRLPKERPRIDPNQLDEFVHRAVFQVEQAVRQAGNHDPGHEMRQIGDGLRRSLEGGSVHGIYHERQYDGRRKTEQQVKNTDRESNAYRPTELGIGQKRSRSGSALPTDFRRIRVAVSNPRRP